MNLPSIVEIKMIHHLDNYPTPWTFVELGDYVIAAIDYNAVVFGKVIAENFPQYQLKIDKKIGNVSIHTTDGDWSKVWVNNYEVKEVLTHLVQE